MPEQLIRLSVGLEEARELIADLSQVLDQIVPSYRIEQNKSKQILEHAN